MSIETGRRRRSPAALAAPLLGAAMLGVLAGCGILDDPEPCPRVSVLQQARVLTLYGEGAGREDGDVAFEVELREASGRCDYTIDEDGGGGVEVAFSLPIHATRGPAAAADRVSAPYFVALTDGERRIVAKEVFTAEIAFDDEGRGRANGGVRRPVDPAQARRQRTRVRDADRHPVHRGPARGHQAPAGALGRRCPSGRGPALYARGAGPPAGAFPWRIARIVGQGTGT